MMNVAELLRMNLPMLVVIKSRFTQVSTKHLLMLSSKVMINYKLAPYTYNLSLSEIKASCTVVRK